VTKELVIEPKKTAAGFLGELWAYRELFFFLAWRDILVRYKQTAIGITWSVLRPLLTMIVLTIVFGKIARLPSGGAPYPVLVFAAMLPWQFFSNTLSESSNSLISNAQMVSKVYFPRLIIPTTSMVVSLVDFVIAFGILIALMLWYGFYPDSRILVLPALLLLAMITSLGTGIGLGPQCKISRLPLRDPVCRTVWAVHLPSWIQQRPRPRAVASALFHQPNGRRHRRLPVGDTRRRDAHLLARIPALRRARPAALHHRCPLFPEDRAILRGCDLAVTTAISIENLSKRYIIGHQRREGYATLRDVLMHKLRGLAQRIRHPLSVNAENTQLEEFWALKDINLEIAEGECVGVSVATGRASQRS
jgi:hypothetical protein